jgi:rare lipoprotein A
MRRALATFVALMAALMAPFAAVPSARGAEDPRIRRAALLLRSAELTDRLEVAQAAVVAAQTRQRRAHGALARIRDRLRCRAVSAYVRGPEAALAAVKAPQPYLEVAAAKERQLMGGYRAAASEAAADRDRAEAAAAALRRTAAELARVQAELEAVIAADDLERAEDQRQADEARLLALQGAGTGSAPPTGSASPGGYAPTPLAPHALLPRHWEATRRQLELMRRVPFGPLAPGAPLPGGLRATGQRVVGNASWYGPGFNGRPTASGAIYDQEAWTVASKELPLGTILLVTKGERRVLLLVNDRGPYVGDRVLDLSAAAARAVGLSGVGLVVADVVGSA